MNKAFRCFAMLMAPWVLSGCGLALLQTGRTVPPQQVTFTGGNNASVRQGIDDLPQIGADLGVRVGVSESVDVGFDSFLTSGAKGSAKLALLPRSNPWAFAVHGGFGLAAPEYDGRVAVGGEAGMIGSYHGHHLLVPYVGLRWLNVWIPPKHVAGEPRMATPVGYGNGALLPTVGLRLGGPRTAAFFEYLYIAPVTSDVGDGWAFTGTHLFSVAVSVCVTTTCAL